MDRLPSPVQLIPQPLEVRVAQPMPIVACRRRHPICAELVEAPQRLFQGRTSIVGTATRKPNRAG